LESFRHFPSVKNQAPVALRFAARNLLALLQTQKEHWHQTLRQSNGFVRPGTEPFGSRAK